MNITGSTFKFANGGTLFQMKTGAAEKYQTAAAVRALSTVTLAPLIAR